MSIWFNSISGEGLWNPSHRAGQFFLGGVRLLERTTRAASGVGELANDEVSIDPKVLARFVDACQSQLSHSTMKAQAVGVIAMSIVLLQRAGSDQPIANGWEELVELVESSAAAMPR